MDSAMSLIERFLTIEEQGVCTDPVFEFGNTYRKYIRCNFCIDGKCHYSEECDRRDVPDQNLGWRSV